MNNLERLEYLAGLLHNRVTGWIILVFSVIITILAWHTSNVYVEKRGQERFEFKVEEARWSILKRMREYEQVLRGGVGLFNVSNAVTRRNWHDYVNTLQIETYWPGIQGIGFSRMVSASQREALVRQVREAGFPQFDIQPAGERDPVSAIIFLEPFMGRNLRAFGYDMWSEPVRRAAMAQARDSGQAALSGRVTLVQETDQDVQAGFLMYLPVYRIGMPVGTVEERQAALMGFVYSPFRIRDLMEGILGHGDPDLDFELFDGSQPEEANRLYSSRMPEEGGRVARYSRDGLLELPGGRVWLARFVSRPVFEQEMESHQSMIIGLLGMMVDLLLFVIVWSLAGQKERVQRQAQKIALELNQAEMRYRRMVENVKDVIFQTDAEGRWSFLNPAWEDLSGYTIEESLGRPFLAHVHADDRTRSWQRFEKLVCGELHFFQEEYRGVHRNGDSVWVEVFVTALIDNQGVCVGTSGILRDITMRKEIDSMMIRARNAAESANRAKSEFLANMSHELRSPLNSLLILSKLLAAERNLTAEQVESVRVIHESGKDLLHLINDILDLSKVEAGRMEVLAESVQLVAFVHELLDPFRVIARSKDLTLTLDLEPELPEAFVTDAGKLKHIIDNLLSNALKFTEKGGVILRVERASDAEVLPLAWGQVLVFRVIDTGIGVPEAMREVIFESFRQANGALSRQYGGTGLGLSIARKLAGLINGTIRVVSRAGGGSEFVFHVPELSQEPVSIVRAPPVSENASLSDVSLSAGVLSQSQSSVVQPVEPSVVEEAVAEQPLLVNGKPVTVMVVDDDMRFAFSLASGLQKRVEHVLLAANGSKALKQLAQHAGGVQAILMDMRMPELDGFDTIRSIRADGRWSELVILAFTAMAMPGDEAACLAAGADGYLAKPATMEAIWEKLEQLLVRPQQPD